jgi:hypothetical protein
MDSHPTYSSDVAFTPSVKAVQARKGSRRAYAHQEAAGAWQTCITADLASFIAAQTSVFLATANRDGQPYIQHRGGPPGFLRVLDEKTIGFADFAGNRQYVTLGNLADNPKAFLFLIDYGRQRRVKIWGEARAIEDDPALTAKLMPDGYKARPSRPGTPIARNIFRGASKPPTSSPRSKSATSASRRWRRRSKSFARRRRSDRRGLLVKRQQKARAFFNCARRCSLRRPSAADRTDVAPRPASGPADERGRTDSSRGFGGVTPE